MSTENKVIIFGGILTVGLVIGAVFFLTKEPSSNVPDSEVITKSGLHWHPNLTIIIDNKKLELPANIGLSGATHQKIHTHDTDSGDGVVHVEASGVVVKDDIRLGNFFRIWGKEFSSTKILDKVNSEGKKVRMMVNGKDSKEFENYQMKDGDKIEINYY